MKSFWAGFEKKSSVPGNLYERLAPALVGASVGQVLGAYAMNSETDHEELLSKKELLELANKIKKEKGLKTKIVFQADRFMPVYMPDEDTVYMPPKATRSSIAHELGHAASIGKLLNSGGLGRLAGTIAHAMGQLAPLGPGLSGHPLGGFLFAAPQLAEEVSASARALSDLHKHEGKDAMTAALPSLLKGLGSYAAIPAASGLFAYLLKKAK